MKNLVRRVAAFLIIGIIFFFVGAINLHAEDYSAKVKAAMKMLIAKAAEAGVPKLDGATLIFGETEMNGNYDIVDEVAEANGCTATFFVTVGSDFKRISTNVIKDGNRAVGTILDPKGPAIAKIKVGESYYGPADILGTMYETGYEPIKDASGKTIGVFYVGYIVQK